MSDHLLTLDVHPQSQPAIKAAETVYYAWRTVPHGVIYGGPGSMCAPRSREIARTLPLLTRARVYTWRQSPERDGRQDEAIHAGVGQATERADGAEVVLRPELMHVSVSASHAFDAQ